MRPRKQAERASSAGAPPPDLPGFDTARALARLGDNEPLLRRLRKLFHRNHHASAAELRAAWDRGDLDHVRILAHTLKGVAATIGADVLARAAADLEQVARDAAEDRDATALEAFERAFGEALEGLAADG